MHLSKIIINQHQQNYNIGRVGMHSTWTGIAFLFCNKYASATQNIINKTKRITTMNPIKHSTNYFQNLMLSKNIYTNIVEHDTKRMHVDIGYNDYCYAIEF